VAGAAAPLDVRCGCPDGTVVGAWESLADAYGRRHHFTLLPEVIAPNCVPGLQETLAGAILLARRCDLIQVMASLPSSSSPSLVAAEDGRSPGLHMP